MSTTGATVIAALAVLALVNLGGGIALYRRRARLRSAGSPTTASSWALALLLAALLLTGTAAAYLLFVAAAFPRGGF